MAPKRYGYSTGKQVPCFWCIFRSPCKNSRILLGLCSQTITPDPPASCFKFLDRSHILMMFDKDLRIYDFQPDAPSGGSSTTPPRNTFVTVDECPCTLRLPALSKRGIQTVRKQILMRSSSAFLPQEVPLFRHDPALAIVCITFSLKFVEGGLAPTFQEEHYMFIIPVPTVLHYAERSRDA